MVEHGEYLGQAALLIRTPRVQAALSLHGGQLLSCVPHGSEDLLWLSTESRRAPAAIRGGAPVCWPYFGREGQPPDAPQHGFARNLPWTLDDLVEDAEGGVRVELSLPVHSSTPLRVTQSLHLGEGWQQSLTTTNTGSHSVAFTQALHSYFRVGDALRAAVHGVEGLQFSDRYDGQLHTQTGEWTLMDPRDPGRSDRTYRDAGDCFLLVDPALRRRIEVTTTGSRSLVLWNPGPHGVSSLGDVAADGWRGFVCLEAANAGADVITIAPGQAHMLSQKVSVSRL